MSLPCYGDLGKSARDVFGKGFHFGVVKLDVKSKGVDGSQVSSGGVSNIDSGKVTGNIEVKTKRCPHSGLQVTNKFSSDNVLNTTLDIQVTPELDSIVAPDRGFNHNSYIRIR